MALPAIQAVQVLAHNGTPMLANTAVTAPAPLAPAQAPAPAPQPVAAPAVQPAALAWAAPPRRRNCKPPALGVKFKGDPKQLGFFPAQLWTYMQEFEPDLLTKGTKVQCVTMALLGTIVEWMVTLHNDTLELRNFEHFMTALEAF